MGKYDYDVVIVGSGSNGLAAAIYLQSKGLKTIVVEKESMLGGATKTTELTLPGYKHDVGAAVLPMAYSSPFFQQLPLEDFGLEWIYPEIPFAQTLGNSNNFGAVACYQDIDKTAAQLGADESTYRKFMRTRIEDWPLVSNDILAPIKIPENPLQFLDFGRSAILSARTFTRLKFKTEESKVLFYGAAAHSTLPLNSTASASFGLVLMIMAHLNGWPFPKSGAGQIIEALAKYYIHVGGEVKVNSAIEDFNQIPNSKVQVFDLTPKQLLTIKSLPLSALYQKRLSNFKYGAGVFKMDWALRAPVPFKNKLLRKAGTVHIGFSSSEIENSEKIVNQGKLPGTPYVLLVQPSVFDHSRTPDSGHTVWAYCHVPNGNTKDCTKIIESQIERAAPGFGKLILKRHLMNTRQLEEFDANLVGGDINGGKQDITQLFTRPVAKLSPYKTSNNNIYICSSSTPPGGGVHGMAGFNAAKQVLKDHF